MKKILIILLTFISISAADQETKRIRLIIYDCSEMGYVEVTRDFLVKNLIEMIESGNYVHSDKDVLETNIKVDMLVRIPKLNEPNDESPVLDPNVSVDEAKIWKQDTKISVHAKIKSFSIKLPDGIKIEMDFWQNHSIAEIKFEILNFAQTLPDLKRDPSTFENKLIFKGRELKEYDDNGNKLRIPNFDGLWKSHKLEFR